MSRRAAILGLGQRGSGWADACLASGWQVSGFDPDARAGGLLTQDATARRAATISETVGRADLIITGLPERLELVQMVLQRAQASAPEDAVLCVDTQLFDLEDLQSCAIRPGHIFRLSETETGSIALDTSPRNRPQLCQSAEMLVTELMAARSLSLNARPHMRPPNAESA